MQMCWTIFSIAISMRWNFASIIWLFHTFLLVVVINFQQNRSICCSLSFNRCEMWHSFGKHLNCLIGWNWNWFALPDEIPFIELFHFRNESKFLKYSNESFLKSHIHSKMCWYLKQSNAVHSSRISSLNIFNMWTVCRAISV